MCWGFLQGPKPLAQINMHIFVIFIWLKVEKEIKKVYCTRPQAGKTRFSQSDENKLDNAQGNPRRQCAAFIVTITEYNF